MIKQKDYYALFIVDFLNSAHFLLVTTFGHPASYGVYLLRNNAVTGLVKEFEKIRDFRGYLLHHRRRFRGLMYI